MRNWDAMDWRELGRYVREESWEGADIITTAARIEGSYYCIIAIEDNTTLDWTAMGTTTDVNWEHPGVVSDFDLDLITGVPYYGDFKAVQLVDGKVIAYKQ